jgi:hypothetical protein
MATIFKFRRSRKSPRSAPKSRNSRNNSLKSSQTVALANILQQLALENPHALGVLADLAKRMLVETRAAQTRHGG